MHATLLNTSNKASYRNDRMTDLRLGAFAIV